MGSSYCAFGAVLIALPWADEEKWDGNVALQDLTPVQTPVRGGAEGGESGGEVWGTP
jgi:hypothetical protein